MAWYFGNLHLIETNLYIEANDSIEKASLSLKLLKLIEFQIITNKNDSIYVFSWTTVCQRALPQQQQQQQTPLNLISEATGVKC